jgi:copper(I)-binding protein
MKGIPMQLHAAGILFVAAAGCLALPSVRAADLCVDSLCIVRAQVKATHHWTRYQPVHLIVENRTDKPRTIKGLSSSAAESVRVLDGDNWDQRKPAPLHIGPNEYWALDGEGPRRLMLIGLKQQLLPGKVIFIEMIMRSGNRLRIPVKVL